MKICFVYKEDYPWDVRVEKIVRTLSDAGHEVTILARNNASRVTEEDLGFCRVRRLPRLPRWCRGLNSLFGLPLFWNPIWLIALFEVLRFTSAPLVIVRDLPLMPAALVVAGLLRRKVIFDMAECYPEMYHSIYEFNDHRVFNWIAKNPAFTAFLERISVRNACHIWVMIDESRDRLLRMGCPADKITIVSNTPPLNDPALKRHERREVLRLLYVGFITRIRGLDNILNGIREYLDSEHSDTHVEFHVVGKGEALAEYRARVVHLELDSHVKFHGWCEQSFVDELYGQSDVGVLTYRVCGHWNHTIPNKLFDYMLSSMPVLATNVVPIQRIVEHEECGIIVTDGDVEECARAIEKLTDPEYRSVLGKNGYESILKQYNWNIDSARLLKVVEREFNR